MSADVFMRLDDEQAEAARAQANCVVTAGAGAGKTTTLTARYVHLVMDKRIPVERILALTFTRKAAAEMYGRIYGELAKLAASGEQGSWASVQLANFANAQIMTLDAFCARIVREGARDFGYTPDFTIDETQVSDLITTLAKDFVVENMQKAGLSDLLRAHPLDSVAFDLFADVAKRYVTPRALLTKQFEPMKTSVRELLAETLRAQLQKMLELSKSILQIAATPGDHGKDSLAAIAAAQGFAAHATAISSIVAPTLRATLEPILEQCSCLVLRGYKKNENETLIKDAAGALRDLAKNVKALQRFEDFLPVYDAVLDRLDEFALLCAQAKRSSDVMDYKDLGLCAVDLLTRRKDLRQKWKTHNDSILIDEFQDNNDLQRDLLFLLAEQTDTLSDGVPPIESLAGDKLFFVGDEKQSIYRFRGADVSVFKRLAKDLAQEVPANEMERTAPTLSHNFTISTNYRSTPKLIDFFNSFFSYALAAEFESKKKAHSDELVDFLSKKENVGYFFAEYVQMHAPKSEPSPEAREYDNAGEANSDGEAAPHLGGVQVYHDDASPESSIQFFYLDNDLENDENDADGDVDNDEVARDEDARDEGRGNAVEGGNGTNATAPDDVVPNGTAFNATGARRNALLEADDNLAFEIARFIKENVGKLPVRPGNVPARYEDFAVLLRTTSNQGRLEKYLRLLDIPFESQSQRSLFNESAAKDLYYVLKLFEDPGDKFAFAAVLRSPLCRVTDEGFLALMTMYNGSDINGKDFKATPQSLFDKWSTVQTPDGATFDFGEYDKQMLQRASAFYSALAQKAPICSVADLVRYTWHFSGIRLDIASRSDSSFYLEQFDHLFEIAAGIDDKGGNLGDFLDTLRPFIEGKREDFESTAVRQRRQSGVQVMTIHKAKGLEFPIVIVPWVESAGSNARSTKLWHMLPEGITIDIKPYDEPDAKAHNVFFELNSELESLKEDAEIRRLLYVACTRAKDHLFFFGRKRKYGPVPKSFMAYLEGYTAQNAAPQSGSDNAPQTAPRSMAQSALQSWSDAPGSVLARVPGSALARVPGSALARVPLSAPLLEKIYIKPSTFDDVRNLQKTKQETGIKDFIAAYEKADVISVPPKRIRTSAVAVNAAAVVNAFVGGTTELPAKATGALMSANSVTMTAAPIPADRFGTLCHDAVEWGIVHPAADGLFPNGFAPSRAVAKGLEREPLARAVELAVQLALGFLNSAYWKQTLLLGDACKVTTEKPFLLRADEMLVEGRMDLFVERTDGIDIIDFKSDATQDSARYATQLELYRMAAQEFAPGKSVRLGIFWLRTAELAWLQSETGDALLAALREIGSEAADGAV